jgi:hypothetical protein
MSRYVHEAFVPRYILTVATTPLPGREDEYNRWYDGIHLAQVLSLPGFVSAERFVVEDGLATPARRYLAVYDIESDDIQATMTAFRQFSAGLDPEPSLDLDTVDVQLYRSLGGPIATTGRRGGVPDSTAGGEGD